MLAKTLLPFTIVCNFATLFGLWIAYEAAPATLQARIGHELLLWGAGASIVAYVAFAFLVMRPKINEAKDGNKNLENGDIEDFRELFLREQDSRNKYQEQSTLAGLEIEQLKKDVSIQKSAAASARELSERLQKQLQEASQPKPDPLCDELKKLAKQDAEKLKERIHQSIRRIDFHLQSGTDPYLDIIAELWNGSIFDLINLNEVAGHATYAGEQLPAAPRIMMPTETLNLKHGDKVTLVVRQYLSSDRANMMEVHRGRSVPVDFENVTVRFDSFSLHGIARPLFRWVGPKFAIEDTQRV